jgi:hypothetical protein
VLPWRPGCASPLLESITDENNEQTLSHWHTLCAGADLHSRMHPKTVSGRPLSSTRERAVESHPYAKDERLTVMTVALPDVVVAGTNGARHRARCVLLDESKRAAPLQSGDVLIVRSMNSGLAVVERVTAGRPDGCWYVWLDFRPLSPQD